MKLIFEDACIELITFAVSDIITTSPTDGNIGDNDGEIDWEG